MVGVRVKKWGKMKAAPAGASCSAPCCDLSRAAAFHGTVHALRQLAPPLPGQPPLAPLSIVRFYPAARTHSPLCSQLKEGQRGRDSEGVGEIWGKESGSRMEGKPRERYSEGADRQVGEGGRVREQEAGGREEGFAKRGRAARGCTHRSRRFETLTSAELFSAECAIACAASHCIRDALHSPRVHSVRHSVAQPRARTTH